MKLVVEIEMNNGEFEQFPVSQACTILKRAVVAKGMFSDIHPGEFEGKIYDINGNSIGFYKVVE